MKKFYFKFIIYYLVKKFNTLGILSYNVVYFCFYDYRRTETRKIVNMRGLIRRQSNPVLHEMYARENE